MNNFISQLINEPYLIAIPLIIIFGAYWGYLIKEKKNKIANLAGEIFYTLLVCILSIFSTVYYFSFLYKTLVQDKSMVKSNFYIFIIPIIVIIIIWIVFIKKLIKIKNK